MRRKNQLHLTGIRIGCDPLSRNGFHIRCIESCPRLGRSWPGVICFHNCSTLGTIAALRGCTICTIPALRTIKLRRPTLHRQVNLSLSWAGRSGFGPSPAGTIVPGEWGLRCRLMTSVPFRCELSHWMVIPRCFGCVLLFCGCVFDF